VAEPAILPESTALRIVRRILLAALWLGTIGTGAELLLLEHYEEWRQMIPLGLLAGGVLALFWHAIHRSAAPLRVIQLLMLLFVAAGVTGLVLHYRGNAEFELEMYPSKSGWELVRESMMGATPALAPGTMIQLALIGLAYSYRHPLLRRDADVTNRRHA
jgi:hypothetical protein